MNHEEKIAAIQNMLVLEGHVGLIRPEEQKSWVIPLYQRQSESVLLLRKWFQRPMVATSLLTRWLQMDDGEGATQTVNDAIYSAFGLDACSLVCSKAFYIIEDDQLSGLKQLLRILEVGIPSEIQLQNANSEALIRTIIDVYWAILNRWRKEGVCHVDGDTLDSIGETIGGWSLQLSDELKEKGSQVFLLGRPIAQMFWNQLGNREWRSFCADLRNRNASPTLIVLALIMAYKGPSYLLSTISDARRMGVKVPEPQNFPIAGVDIENLKIRHGITIEKNQEIGDILQKFIPGLKAWIDLEITHRTFSPHDPKFHEFIENELKSNVALRMCYETLDVESWSEMLT
jgi:hypothetical protein